MNKEKILAYIDVYDATPADKRKRKIEELADGLGEQPWEVAETLKKAGCSVNGHWFAQQKIKMQKQKGVAADKDEAAAAQAAEMAAAAEGTSANKAYLQKIIKEQDRQLRERKAQYDKLVENARTLAETIRGKDRALAEKDAALRQMEKELDGYREAADDRAGLLRLIEQHEKKITHYERTCEEKDVQTRRLQSKIDELKLHVNEVDNANAALHKQLDMPLHGAAALKEAAEAEPDAQTPRFEMAPAKEYPSFRAPDCKLDLADLINTLCVDLRGAEAYLCGRILEALWSRKIGGRLQSLRVLGGLVSELIEMELDEQEAAVCSN